MLANAINEELGDRCRDVQVPSLVIAGAAPARRDPLTVLDEVFGPQPAGCDPA